MKGSGDRSNLSPKRSLPERGSFPVAGRIHRLEVPTAFPVGAVNVYVIDGQEPVLIDTGPNTPEAWDSLLHGLRRLGAAVDQIRHIVITHGHADHYGLASRIAAESGALVWVHRNDREMVQDYPRALYAWLGFLRDFLPETGLEPAWIERLDRAIERRQDYAASVHAVHLLHDGERLDLGEMMLAVVHTPGHSPGSICLYSQAERLLFAGDHLLRERELTIMRAKEELFPGLPDAETLLALFDVIGHLDLLRREGAVRVERRGGLLYARAA